MADINIIAVISKLRPKIKAGRKVNLDDIADEIATQSGFDRGDARDFSYKFTQALIRHLQFGDSVTLGEIGNFRLNTDAQKKLKVSYRASQEIKTAVNSDFRGEFVNGQNVGLTDEDYAQLWLATNPNDTVIMRDKSTRTS